MYLCNYRELAVLISCTAAHKDLNVELEMSVSTQQTLIFHFQPLICFDFH